MAHGDEDVKDEKEAGLATRAIHADAAYVQGSEVAPNISVTTTFRNPPPGAPQRGEPVDVYNPSYDIYSRYTQPTLTRAEKVLSSIIGAPTLVFPSGISATYALLLQYCPDIVAITGGYHGVHGALEVYSKSRGFKAPLRIIDLDDKYPDVSEGSFLCWVETPLNPTGESRSIEYYAKKAHAVGGKLAIDSTFAPPPLQDPFAWGADAVMHSGTKYFLGHSDALIGTVSVKTKEEWLQLWHNRTYTGANAGSLEAWLLLRSLRTLELRVVQQATTATKLAQWLASLTRAAPDTDNDGPAGVVEKVWHTSLQDVDGTKWVGEGKQMKIGPACFAMRLSIGVERFEDLKADLTYGLRKVVKMDQDSKL